jgi:hypothetical protein
MSVSTDVVAFEEWEVLVPSMIRLDVLTTNRFGQAMRDRLVLGPDRVGMKFRISTADRVDNQSQVVNEDQDPFRNGMLRRVDGDQQADPLTASTDVLTGEDMVDLIDLPDPEFQERVKSLGEVPVRRLLELAPNAGASHAKVVFLENYIKDAYIVGGRQDSIFGDVAEKRPS